MKLGEIIDDGFRGLLTLLGHTAATYCDLETVYTENDILVARDGSMATILRWNGSLRMIGDREYEEVVNSFEDRLSSLFNNYGHQIQVVFNYEGNESDPASTLGVHFKSMQTAARKLHLDVDDILRDRYRKLSQFCANESCYVVLWTNPDAINKEDRQEDRQRHRKEVKGLPLARNAQYLHAAIDALLDTHRSFVDSITAEMKRLQMDVAVLDVAAALHVVRYSVDPDYTDASWRPSIPGDSTPPVRVPSRKRDDISHLMWPSLHSQLIPRECYADKRHVKIGDRLWAPVMVNLPPKKTFTFQEFFTRMRASGTPYRVSFRIAGGGMTALGFNKTMASGLQVGSRRNKIIHEAFEIQQRRLDKGASIVSLGISAATWSRSNQPDRLKKNASILARGLQSWGGCDVAEVTGNPMRGVMDSVPGMNIDTIAPKSAPELGEAARLLPWQRAASPWRRGSMLLRSGDGKPYPFAPYSAEQNAWVNLYFAPMGAAKSVTASCQNLSLVLDPENDDLPLIRILDIGPSSSGFISLMQNALPADQMHRSVYRRLRMDKRDAINPMDTMYGQRFPTPGHRSFLQNLLTLLGTPIGENAAPVDGLSDLAMAMIDMAYKQYADGKSSSPRVYSPRVDLVIDEELQKTGIAASIDKITTWWEIFDAFHERGMTRMAQRAQRYAMPLIREVAALARDQSVIQAYSRVKTVTDETLPDYFFRKLRDACSNYPILEAPTAFDLGDAAIVSLDLQEVAVGESDAALHQSAVVYMMALWVMGRDFFVGDEMLEEIDERYRSFHARNVKELKGRRKRVFADELHRPVRAAPIVMKILESWVREGRKWRLDMSFASQRHQDFPPWLVELATSIYILKGPQTGAKELGETFQLNETERRMVERNLPGPGKEGAPMLAKFVTKHGNFTHRLVNTIGARELWAFNTTAADRAVRDQLYKQIGPRKARDILATVYPGGTVEDEKERRLELLNAQGGNAENISIEDQIVEELVELANRPRTDRAA